MKFKKAFSIVISCSLIFGVAVSQLVTGTAKEECTCFIEMHGSNCPLSACECSWQYDHDGRSVTDHDEGCPLYGMNKDALFCTCEVVVHAEGCPCYLEDADDEYLYEPVVEYYEEVSDEPEIIGDDAYTMTYEEIYFNETDDEDAGIDKESAKEFTGEEILEKDTVRIASPSDAEVVVLEEDAHDGKTETSEIISEDVSEEKDIELGTDVEEKEADNEGLSVLDPEDAEPPVSEEVDPDWEYPTGWEGYGGGKMQGNVLVAEKSFSMPAILDTQVNKVKEFLSAEHDVRIVDTEDNFADVLAVYAVLSGQEENYPYDVTIDDEFFNSVYWSMTQITGVSNADQAVVRVKRLNAHDAAELYNMDESEEASLSSLANMNDVVEDIVGKSIFAKLDDEEYEYVTGMVENSLSPARRAVLISALSLNGKVNYFWGGKSIDYGWDERWGEMRTVSTKGSKTYGTYRSLGLDCSGFVSWAFINAFGPDYGTLSSADWNKNTPRIEWKEAKPGDIALTDGHVGIVLTSDENGPTSYIHCSTGGVSITNDIGTFDWLVRPTVFGD